MLNTLTPMLSSTTPTTTVTTMPPNAPSSLMAMSHHHHSPHLHSQTSSQAPLPLTATSTASSTPSPSALSTSGPPHFVDLHVNPGESVSLQFFDGNETILRGPTTIKMVSNSAYPPMALPVQVPPGHMIQQIVDENGTLRHIVLSALSTTATATAATAQQPSSQQQQQQPQSQTPQPQSQQQGFASTVVQQHSSNLTPFCCCCYSPSTPVQGVSAAHGAPTAALPLAVLGVPPSLPTVQPVAQSSQQVTGSALYGGHQGPNTQLSTYARKPRTTRNLYSNPPTAQTKRSNTFSAGSGGGYYGANSVSGVVSTPTGVINLGITGSGNNSTPQQQIPNKPISSRFKSDLNTKNSYTGNRSYIGEYGRTYSESSKPHYKTNSDYFHHNNNNNNHYSNQDVHPASGGNSLHHYPELHSYSRDFVIPKISVLEPPQSQALSHSQPTHHPLPVNAPKLVNGFKPSVISSVKSNVEQVKKNKKSSATTTKEFKPTTPMGAGAVTSSSIPIILTSQHEPKNQFQSYVPSSNNSNSHGQISYSCKNSNQLSGHFRNGYSGVSNGDILMIKTPNSTTNSSSNSQGQQKEHSAPKSILYENSSSSASSSSQSLTTVAKSNSTIKSNNIFASASSVDEQQSKTISQETKNDTKSGDTSATKIATVADSDATVATNDSATLAHESAKVENCSKINEPEKKTRDSTSDDDIDSIVDKETQTSSCLLSNESIVLSGVATDESKTPLTNGQVMNHHESLNHGDDALERPHISQPEFEAPTESEMTDESRDENSDIGVEADRCTDKLKPQPEVQLRAQRSPRHLLPKVEAIALSQTLITHNSCKLKWCLNPTASGVDDASPSRSVKRHFVVEHILSQVEAEESDQPATRIVFQGHNLSCRVTQLQPSHEYTFRVRSSTETSVLVSNLLVLTTQEMPSFFSNQRSSNAGRRSKHQLQQQVLQQQQQILQQQHQLLLQQRQMADVTAASGTSTSGNNTTGSGRFSLAALEHLSLFQWPVAINPDQRYALAILIAFSLFALVTAIAIQRWQNATPT